MTLINDSTYIKDSYLIARGLYLLGLAIYVWVGVSLQFILGSVLTIIHCRKESKKQKHVHHVQGGTHV